MTLWRCSNCQAMYAIGLTRCPQCHGTEWEEEGKVPKISREQGATVFDRNAALAANATPEQQEPPTPEPEKEEPPTGEVAGSEPTEQGWATEVTPPKRNASKSEWVQFAEEHGFEGDPDELTRDELVTWWETPTE